MPRLLVSVRDREEYRMCSEQHVDLIDFKEPLAGPLEPTDPELWRWAGENAHSQLSLALGELKQLKLSANRAGDLARSIPNSPAIRYAKFGWSHLDLNEGTNLWQAWQQVCPAALETVLVAYADYQHCEAPSPEALCDWGSESGISTLLVDTFDKSRGSVWNHLSIERLTRLAQRQQDRQGQFVLAGSLRLSDQANIERVGPDIVAIRGGACRTDRTSSLDPKLIAQWLDQFSAS